VSNAESACSCGDLDGDFEPSKKLLRRPSGVKSYVRKKNQKKVSSNQSQSISKGEVSLCITLIKCGCPLSCVDSILPEPSVVEVFSQGS
jgi:hypothetical protein